MDRRGIPLPVRGADECGFALLAVLVILAILTPLVVNLGYRTMVQLSGADYLASKVKSREIARAGLESALVTLKKDDKAFDSHREEWGAFAELSRLSDTFFEEGGFSGEIRDEEGKINLNRLTPESDVERQMTRLLEMHNVDTDLLDAVIDWIDPDREPELTGAEDDYYSALDNPYNAKDGPMNTLSELRLVKGMTGEVLYGSGDSAGIYPFVSVYGNDARVNINTAPREVLAVLSDDLAPAQVDEILFYREEESFRNEEDVRKLLGDDAYNLIRSKIKVKSDVFSISVRGEHREVVTEVTAVVSRSGENMKIIYYSEG